MLRDKPAYPKKILTVSKEKGACAVPLLRCVSKLFPLKKVSSRKSRNKPQDSQDIEIFNWQRILLTNFQVTSFSHTNLLE